MGGFGPDFDVVVGLIASLIMGKGIDIEFILLFHGIPTHTVYFFGGLLFIYFILKRRNSILGRYLGYFLVGYFSHLLADIFNNCIDGFEPFIKGKWGLYLVNQLPSYLTIIILGGYSQIAIWDAAIILSAVFLIYYAVKLDIEIRKSKRDYLQHVV